MAKRKFVDQYDKDSIDRIAEQEGRAVQTQRAHGNLRSQGGRKRRKNMTELQDEAAQKRTRPLVDPERDRGSFRKTGI